MVLFKNKYRTETTRKPEWDYSEKGLYFITICTKDRIKYFGEIINGKMILSDLGKIAQKCLIEIPNHFQHTQLDKYVIMPNHIHFILEIMYNALININDNVNVETQNFASLHNTQTITPGNTKPIHVNQFGPQSKNLASIVRGFKIGVKKWATNNKINFNWQSSFYDVIIKNEKSLNNIRQYIEQNSLNWNLDEYR